MKTSLKVAIIVPICVVVVTAILVPLILHYRRRWPLKFSLSNRAKAIAVDVYVNSAKLNGSPFNIAEGVQLNFEIGKKNNAINPLTGKYFPRSQVKNITVQLPTDGNIYFESNNIPPYTITGAPNLAGFAPFDKNPGNNFLKAGYYQIQFGSIPFF